MLVSRTVGLIKIHLEVQTLVGETFGQSQQVSSGEGGCELKVLRGLRLPQSKNKCGPTAAKPFHQNTDCGKNLKLGKHKQRYNMNCSYSTWFKVKCNFSIIMQQQ